MSAAVAKPLPRVTEALAPYFEAARRGELAVQRCRSCGELRFPPRDVCPTCWSRDREWTAVSGRGEVYSFYWMHQLYHPGFAADLPYPVVVVRLEEGPKLTTNLVECAKDELRVGLPVEVVFEERSAEVSLPQFRPRRG